MPRYLRTIRVIFKSLKNKPKQYYESECDFSKHFENVVVLVIYNVKRLN